MRFILILCTLFFIKSSYAVPIISGKSPIIEVTVFKDRAFVKRRQYINLKKGNYSIKFESLTSQLNKESIKVLVPSEKHIEVFGVRTEDKYLEKSENKKLNDLERKKNKLVKKTKKISNTVEGLIKEHSDLKILSQHYNESFSLSLHKNKWSKKKFVSFLNFLEKRSGKMYSKWKELFLSYIKIYEELNFINAKILELKSLNELKKINVFVDVFILEDKKSWLEVQYLVGNAGWSPVYDIRIDKRSSNAVVEQHALVWQNSGEDWNRVIVKLSNIKAELNPKIPYISSYTLSYKEVKKVKTTVESQVDMIKDLRPMSVQSKNSNLGPREGIAKGFDIKGKQNILSGMSKTKIFIQKKSSKYDEHLELVGKEYLHVYKKGKLQNPFLFTLEKGPLGIYYNDEFIQNSSLQTTMKGRPIFLNAGIDHSLSVTRWMNDKIAKSGIVNQSHEYKRDYKMKIINYSSEIKKILVFEQVPVSEMKEISVSYEGSTKGLKKNKIFPSWYSWDVNLKPNEWKELLLSLKVVTPKGFSFRWP